MEDGLHRQEGRLYRQGRRAIQTGKTGYIDRGDGLHRQRRRAIQTGKTDYIDRGDGLYRQGRRAT